MYLQYILLLTTCFRYLTLCKGCHHQPFLYYLLPIVIGSLAFKFPIFFELRTRSSGRMFSYDRLVVSDLRNNQAYITWYIGVAHLLLTSLLPFAVLAFMYTLVMRKVLRNKDAGRRACDEIGSVCSGQRGRRSSSFSFLRDLGREELVSVMLASVVGIFAVCHFLRIFLNMLEVRVPLVFDAHLTHTAAEPDLNMSLPD